MRLARFALLLFALPAPLSSQPRSLYWRSLDVTTRIDAEGRLRVVERHAMVFTGDWNGGERGFRLAADHSLELQSVEREDLESHSRIPLTENDALSSVDEYAWADSKTLRWRSRLPSNPPFESAERVYVLDYTLENILIPTNGGYLLDHDFAFPDRPGPILSYSLDLSWDESWVPTTELAERVVRENLQPGESVVVRAPLVYRGKGSPSAVRLGSPRGTRIALALLLAVALAVVGLLFYREEKALGRFEPLTPLSSIDRSWLEANVFSMLPEEVGAAWDDSTGAPEVAAVLARMVSEGKLKTEVYRTRGLLKSTENLRMELLVDRGSLSGYESSLVRALFVSGDVTDTVKIRKHYESRGFDPASVLSGPLKQRIARILPSSKTPRRTSRKPGLLVLGMSLLVLAVSTVFDRMGALYLLPGAALAGLLYVVGVISAMVYRKRVDRLLPYSLTFLLPAALIAVVTTAYLVVNPWRNEFLALAAFVLLALALLMSLFNAAKFRAGRIAIDLRKKLASARRYFAHELSKRDPHLEDRWFPYLVALELGPDVDRWFHSYGSRQSESATSTGSSASPGGAGESSRPAWTGGGGAFGGAGATGSWAAAASTVASGVASPSESSSGGSSGGGGGSSGGGSGGGW
jgi:uncharacterized membrane protein YgcG